MIAHFLLHLLPPNFDTFKDMVIHTAEATDTALSLNSVINLLSQPVNVKKVQALLPHNLTALSAQNFSKLGHTTSGPLGCFKQLICTNGKHNPATQHTTEQCWQLHPKLRNPRTLGHTANLTVTSSSSISDHQPTPPAMTTFLLAAFSKISSKVDSILDIGASTPMFKERLAYKAHAEHVKDVSLADGPQIKTQGQGAVDLIGMDSALQIPTLSHNLINLSYLVKRGC